METDTTDTSDTLNLGKKAVVEQEGMLKQVETLEQEEMLEGDGRDCQPLHLQLQVYGRDHW